MADFEIPEAAMYDLQNKRDEAIEQHNELHPDHEIDDEDWLSAEEDVCFSKDHKAHLEH